MRRKPAKHQLSAVEFRRAVKQLQESDLWHIPVTAGEAKRMQKVFDNHECTSGECEVCTQRHWFDEAWGHRIRVLPMMEP